MKMIDETLQELWAIKDNLAKEHAYDLDSLVAYLNEKYQSDGDKAQDHDYPSVHLDMEETKAA
jgi:hypothetical protein